MSQHTASISTLPMTISCMMVTIDQSVSSTSTLSKDLLLTLHSIFGSLLSSALDLVDRMGVTLVRGEESGREVVTVKGSVGMRYTLLKGSHYCPCPSYQYKVVGRGDITCKHLLAVRLAMAMQRVNVVTVPDRQVMQLIEDLVE